MKSLKPYFVGWLSGLLTGLILVERWHRKGALHFLEADAVEVIELDGSTTAMRSAKEPTVTAVIVGAARADAGRARELLVRVVPRGMSPASLGRPRPGGHADTPGNTPNP